MMACTTLRDGSFANDTMNFALKNTKRMDTVVVNMRRRFWRKSRISSSNRWLLRLMPMRDFVVLFIDVSMAR